MAYSPLKRRGGPSGEEDGRTSYTSEFLDTAVGLPGELRKSFCLVKELEEYVYEMSNGITVSGHSTEHAGIEQQKNKMMSKARKCTAMDKPNLEGLRKQWEQLQQHQKKILEIAVEKKAYAEQALRLMDGHMRRLEGQHARFLKELQKSDPEGVAEVLGGANALGDKVAGLDSTAAGAAAAGGAGAAYGGAQPSRGGSHSTAAASRGGHGSSSTGTGHHKKKQKFVTKFDLVGKWIGIEYDDETALAEPGKPKPKVWYKGLVMAYDPNLHSYLISWEVGGEEWLDDLKENEYKIVPPPT